MLTQSTSYLGDGRWQPDAGGTPVVRWAASRYLYILAIAAIPALVGLVVGLVAGGTYLGLLLASVPFAVLILWKPELGLYLMAIGIPFELYAVVGGATGLKILGIFTFVSFLIHLPAGKRIEIRVWALWFAVVLGVWSMLSILGAGLPELAWVSVLTRFQLIGLFVIGISLCATREQAMALLWAMALGAVGAAILGFFVTPEPEAAYVVRRMTVGGQDINQYAKDLMSGLFLAPFLITQTRRWRRLAVAAAIPVVLAAIIATGSRSAYIAVVAGVLVATLTFGGVSFHRRILLSVGAVVSGALFVVVGIAAGFWASGLAGRLVELQERGLAAGGRLRMWQDAIRMGLSHPLLGIGVGNYYPETLQSGMHARVPHNDVLQYFAETGFPGLILYGGFMVAVLARGNKTGHPWLRAGLLGLMTAAFVASLGNPASGLKGFWLQMAAVTIGGLVFVAEQPPVVTRLGDDTAASG